MSLKRCHHKCRVEVLRDYDKRSDEKTREVTASSGRATHGGRWLRRRHDTDRSLAWGVGVQEGMSRSKGWGCREWGRRGCREGGQGHRVAKRRGHSPGTSVGRRAPRPGLLQDGAACALPRAVRWGLLGPTAPQGRPPLSTCPLPPWPPLTLPQGRPRAPSSLDWTGLFPLGPPSTPGGQGSSPRKVGSSKVRLPHPPCPPPLLSEGLGGNRPISQVGKGAQKS